MTDGIDSYCSGCAKDVSECECDRIAALESEVARLGEVIASALEHLEKGATMYVIAELRKEVDGE